MLDPGCAPEICAAFGLSGGRLSSGPVATGRVGEIWRLDTAQGSWAVKTNENPDKERGAAATAGFLEASVASGVPAPGICRTTDGRVLHHIGTTNLRLLEWVDLQPADIRLDPAALGDLTARLHQVASGAWATSMPGHVDPWFIGPVGPDAWDALVHALAKNHAPFAEAMAGHRDELVALESLIEGPGDLRVCHRDLFADNVRAGRASTDPGIVVFDFDNAGPADPAHELAMVLVEFATDLSGRAVADRARGLVEAYEDAGGPARLAGPGAFSMTIAVLGHIAEHASRRWLSATDEATGSDMAGWATEIIDRPLTRAAIIDLLDAVT